MKVLCETLQEPSPHLQGSLWLQNVSKTSLLTSEISISTFLTQHSSPCALLSPVCLTPLTGSHQEAKQEEREPLELTKAPAAAISAKLWLSLYTAKSHHQKALRHCNLCHLLQVSTQHY